MFGKFTYLFWLTIFVWLPELILYLKFRDLFHRYKKTFFFVVGCSVVFSLPWDLLAVKYGIWHFSPALTLGRRFLLLPVEELLLYIFFSLLVSMVTLAILRGYGQ